jgi:hypothetical protein|tara:strand:+ start:152 stop:1291 length:1140 start_codon:yes stop_codon:yes gene_type:complete
LGVFIKKDKEFVEAQDTGYEDGKENKLENLIINNPEIFPVNLIAKPDVRYWIPIAKQVTVATGRTDTLGVDDQGGIYIIENKLKINPDKKTVHQQVRNYAHGISKLRDKEEGWEIFLEKIKSANSSLTEDVKQLSFSNKDLKTIIQEKLKDIEKTEECMKNIQTTFEEGIFTLVIAIDEIPKALRISIDRENELDTSNKLPMFALEVKECKTNSDEIIITTNTYPYDLTELRRKLNSPRIKGDLKIFEEQFKKSNLSTDEKKMFLDFDNNLKKISDEIDFGTGRTSAKLPRFDNSMHNRSPISILSTGQLKIQWSMFWEDLELSKKFRTKLEEIPQIKKEINKKNPKGVLKDTTRMESKIWLPNKDRILLILEEVFVKE